MVLKKIVSGADGSALRVNRINNALEIYRLLLSLSKGESEFSVTDEKLLYLKSKGLIEFRTKEAHTKMEAIVDQKKELAARIEKLKMAVSGLTFVLNGQSAKGWVGLGMYSRVREQQNLIDMNEQPAVSEEEGVDTDLIVAIVASS